MLRVKILSKTSNWNGSQVIEPLQRDDVLFIYDARCRDYDWLVVYDEMPMGCEGVEWEREVLACPRAQTILITGEPPSIKLYPKCYTSQFGYVLTTHSPVYLPHRNHVYGEGSMAWCLDMPLNEIFEMRDYPKSKAISAICSAKQQTHTLHSKRYSLVHYLSEKLPELEWFGRGIREIDKKYEVQNDYRYSVAVENYVAPYHWTDKISDPLLSLCLTFYVGDPRLEDILPAESFIRIPLDDHEEAYRIIRHAIDSGEYEKRLPAIREARRLVVERYNMFSQIANIIRHHEANGKSSKNGGVILGRHRLRRKIWNLLSEAWETLRLKFILKVSNT